MPVAENVLDRNFEVDAPNLAWVTEITYVWTSEGWLYLAAIVDLFSRRVVGFAMSERIDRALVLEALAAAVGRREPNAGLVHHSDGGSHYASNDDQTALDGLGVVCSGTAPGIPHRDPADAVRRFIAADVARRGARPRPSPRQWRIRCADERASAASIECPNSGTNRPVRACARRASRSDFSELRGGMRRARLRMHEREGEFPVLSGLIPIPAVSVFAASVVGCAVTDERGARTAGHA